jgi:DNA-binding NarL/FixJ family response regulator
MIAARSGNSRADLEALVHASPALELVRLLDYTLISNTDLEQDEADVLIVEAGDMQPDRVRVLDGLAAPAVLLTDTPDTPLVKAAFASGFRGVLSREATAEEIEAAIHAVHAGLWVTGSAPASPADSDVLAEPLTDRELEVLDLIAEGLSNKLIAYQLSISEHTVKTHVASILGKLGAASRTEAVSQGIRRGLVKL